MSFTGMNLTHLRSINNLSILTLWLIALLGIAGLGGWKMKPEHKKALIEQIIHKIDTTFVGFYDSKSIIAKHRDICWNC